MKKNAVLCACLFISCHFVWGQIIFEEPLSPRNANYQIQVTYDPAAKQIKGREILNWINISQDRIQTLQFHLYMNAFKNNRSTFARERYGHTGILGEKNAWGWINIDSLKIVNGQDLSSSWAYIQPDDGNPDDQTVIELTLPRSIRPGRNIELEIHFTTQLPWLYRRNGFYEDFVMAGQWFPKIGVYIDGEWNCHQFHRDTEFFADFGNYDIEITLPAEYQTGATGIRQNVDKKGTLKTVTYHAEDVHDFAWTAWPQFLIETRTYDGIEIELLYERDHVSSVERTFEALKRSLDFMDAWIGPYPYPKITVMHPPTGCMNASGMEYPTFFTAGTFWFNPPGFYFLELVTVHEFLHNYWYGIVASNEFEEAWLDEGINSYTEYRIIDQYYGERTGALDIFGIEIGETDMFRLGFIGIPKKDRILRNAWTYIGGGYGVMSYFKSALMLKTLENLIGQGIMDEIIRTYYERWKFKHPKSPDFIDVVNEISGEDYNWFFDQILKGSNELDYAVKSVWTRKYKAAKGVFEQNGKQVTLPLGKDAEDKIARTDITETDNNLYRSVVKIHRQGEVIVPVEILIVFNNGDTIREFWDGKERWTKFEYLRPEKLKYAEVDPDRKLLLDTNFANNSLTVKMETKPLAYIGTKLLYWLQNVLHAFSFIG